MSGEIKLEKKKKVWYNLGIGIRWQTLMKEYIFLVTTIQSQEALTTNMVVKFNDSITLSDFIKK